MPVPSTQAEFLTEIKAGSPLTLAIKYLDSDEIHAMSVDEYAHFKVSVSNLLATPSRIVIAGSGNWRFSLNPEKNFSEYHGKSDLDVAVVSQALFNSTWHEIRKLHRTRWTSLSQDWRQRLRRNGENIYSGFASPKWLPDSNNPMRYSFLSMLSKLSTKAIGYREVNMMYFRDDTEMYDYYVRGFHAAKRGAGK